ncbi:MAG: GNAT family N-acetyltransferase [Propionibacteriaceae bacterium]|jgi:GNAT superfamily N-acetyltransferase|nr:GNAT family N-acetyltransferase [Propionibacteriaceae bacterium]
MSDASVARGDFNAPRRILPTDRVLDFTCGRPELDTWLQRHSLRAEKQGTSTVFVVTMPDDSIAGFSSLSAHGIERESTGGGWLARNTPMMIPAVLLGRLSVAQNAQGRGLGSSLLAHAIAQVAHSSAHIGIRALVVDPIDEAAAAFYARYSFRPFPGDHRRMYIPIRPSILEP